MFLPWDNYGPTVYLLFCFLTPMLLKLSILTGLTEQVQSQLITWFVVRPPKVSSGDKSASVLKTEKVPTENYAQDSGEELFTRCIVFKLPIFNDYSIGIRSIRSKNAMHRGKKFLASIFSVIVHVLFLCPFQDWQNLFLNFLMINSRV